MLSSSWSITDLNVLHELVGGVGVAVGEGGVHRQGDAGTHDGQQDEHLEPSRLRDL